MFAALGINSTIQAYIAIQSAMKLFASRIGLLFAAVFAMSFALHCIYAKDETLDGLRREMEDDEKYPQPLRERRSVKNNATQDILKRLQDMEKKYVSFFCSLRLNEQNKE